MPEKNEILPEPLPIAGRIYTVRGHSVMLDSDLAAVYGVLTKNLNKAVDRNPENFPEDFSFQLVQEEWDVLRFQIGTSNTGRGGRRYIPRVFTEHGAIMLASVLKSPFAINASIQVVRAFVQFRHIMDANLAFARKLDELSAKVDRHDRAFIVVFEELKRLAGNVEPEPPRERIGFKPNKERRVSGKRRK